MTLRTYFAPLIASALLAAPAHADPREDADRVRAQFEQTYNAGDWNRLVTLFTPDAHYFGSVKDELMAGQDGIRGYLAALPRGIKAKMAEHAVVLLEPTVMVSSGYIVTTLPNGAENAFKVTMVLHNVNGVWLIAQYHASRVQKQ